MAEQVNIEKVNKYIINKYKKIFTYLLEGKFDLIDDIEIELKKYIVKVSKKNNLIENLIFGLAIVEREKTYLLAAKTKNTIK